MADQSLLSTVRSDLTAERDHLEAQIASLEPGHGAASPDFDDNFADSGQVAAEQGENKVARVPAAHRARRGRARAGQARRGHLRGVRDVRRGHLLGAPRGDAGRSVLHRPRVGLPVANTSHLVKRFFGSLAPGRAAGGRRGMGPGAVAARRARPVAPDVRSGPSPRGRGRPPSRARAGDRGHASRPGGCAAARRRQDRVRAGHLWARGRDALGPGRRPRTWPRVWRRQRGFARRVGLYLHHDRVGRRPPGARRQRSA